MTLAMPIVRRLRIPTLDARVVGGVVLVAISIVGGLRLTRAPEPATRVYVASTDLDVGHVLSRSGAPFMPYASPSTAFLSGSVPLL